MSAGKPRESAWSIRLGDALGIGLPGAQVVIERTGGSEFRLTCLGDVRVWRIPPDRLVEIGLGILQTEAEEV